MASNIHNSNKYSYYYINYVVFCLSLERVLRAMGPDALEVAQLEYHSPDLNQLKIITIPMTPTVPERQESEPPAEDETTISTLQDVLKGAQNIVYGAREDTPGISFLKGDGTGKEWALVKVMLKLGREYDVNYLKSCRSVTFGRYGDGTPFFNLHHRHFRFPTPPQSAPAPSC